MIKIYNILIIDDQPEICYSLERILKKDDEISVISANKGQEGIEIYKNQNIDIVITDLVIGDINGLEVIEEIKKIKEDAVIILISGKGSEKIAEEAIKKGAYDYFSKPFNYNEFFKTIRNAKEKLYLKKEIENKNKFYNMNFKSEKMYKITQFIKKIASTDLPILITGESGTGKELVAESIHFESNRKDKQIIKINCGAIPINFIESELFGYEKGAYTGAVTSKKGKIELADKGTLFLDEIGEMDIKSQVKLLRILEDGILERIGSEKGKKIDVRIIAATNIDLENAVNEGKFRLDLLYRLNVFTIKMPPLRERKEDIIYLGNIFLNDYSKKMGFSKKYFTENAKKILLSYEWKGNIRELKNLMQNIAVISGNKEEIDETIIENIIKPKKNKEISIKFDERYLKDYMKLKEKEYLEYIIKKYSNNKTEASKILGISRKTLYEKLNDYEIEY